MGGYRSIFSANSALERVELIHTFDNTKSTGRNPLQNPTRPGPVSSYGIHGSGPNAALATE
jgi:hypothetical protein